MDTENLIYQIKVTLRGTRPAIWRRIMVPKNITLRKLHEILQVAMGWTDSHLHHFRLGKAYYGTPSDEGGMKVKNEKNIKIEDLLIESKDIMVYEYDFGDSWEHDVLLEKILPRDIDKKYPYVVKGKGACPPENVGGVFGYLGFLDAISDPDHPEHAEIVEWYGGKFDPEEFDVEEANAYLHHRGKGRLTIA